MKLIVGLGNPGPQYKKTRHNIGERITQAFLQESRASFKKDRNLQSYWSELSFNSSAFLVATPDTYMNESGIAVKKLVDHFQVDFKSDLLVLVDDIAIPFGRLRLRPYGEDGGHKGLRSIQQVLNSPEFARMRIGISPEEPIRVPLEEFVLQSFDSGEEKALHEIAVRSVKACQLWLSEPLEKAMNLINKPSSAQPN